MRNPQSAIVYGSSRFCAIHCGTVCGCCISGSFAPNIFFQTDGDVARLATCGAGAGFVAFFALEPGVTAATVLFHADFVPVATLLAPFFTDCIGDVFGTTGALSTHLFLFASGLAAVVDLLDSAFGIDGMCSDGQLTFFLGVLSIQWLSSDAVVGICASCATGPVTAGAAGAAGGATVAEGNGACPALGACAAAASAL